MSNIIESEMKLFMAMNGIALDKLVKDPNPLVRKEVYRYGF